MNAVVSNTMADKNYAAAMESAAAKTILAVAIDIQGQAMLNVPIKTGRLAGSITYATQKHKGRTRTPATAKDKVSVPTDEWTAYVGSNVEYAQHVEYGAKGRPAKPFLRTALDERRSVATKIAQRAVRRALKAGKEIPVDGSK